MPKYTVIQSIQIEKPIKEVYKTVADFNTWKTWSPWIICEKEAKVNVKDDFYDWEGKLVGAGNMQFTKKEENKSLDIDLTFLKPFKTKSLVGFEFIEDAEDKTTVNWIMEGSLPFFMFFMKQMMSNLIGLDFRRGLTMLKDYCETGEVHSDITYEGVMDYPATQYAGITREVSFDHIGQTMEQDFSKLMTYFKQNHADLMHTEPLSLYHKWDMKNMKCKFTSVIPLSEIPVDLPKEFEVGKIDATKVYGCTHHGPYDFVGNAWAAMQTRARSKVFAQNKKKPPMEVYLNSPMDTAPNDLKSRILFPVK